MIHIPCQGWRKVWPTWWQPANCRLKLRSGIREAIWWGEILLLLTLEVNFARIWGRRRRPPADNSSRHCRRPTQTLTSSRFLAKLAKICASRDLDLGEAGCWRKWVPAKSDINAIYCRGQFCVTQDTWFCVTRNIECCVEECYSESWICVWKWLGWHKVVGFSFLTQHKMPEELILLPQMEHWWKNKDLPPSWTTFRK